MGGVGAPEQDIEGSNDGNKAWSGQGRSKTSTIAPAWCCCSCILQTFARATQIGIISEGSHWYSRSDN